MNASCKPLVLCKVGHECMVINCSTNLLKKYRLTAKKWSKCIFIQVKSQLDYGCQLQLGKFLEAWGWCLGRVEFWEGAQWRCWRRNVIEFHLFRAVFAGFLKLGCWIGPGDDGGWLRMIWQVGVKDMRKLLYQWTVWSELVFLTCAEVSSLFIYQYYLSGS